jgi:predicted metalloprotease with PDZ domain
VIGMSTAMGLMLAAWLLATGMAMGAETRRGQALPAVEYIIRVPMPQTQMLDVEMVLRGARVDPATGGVDIMLPVWRPGRYQVLDLAGGVQDFSAEDEAGVLAVERVDKATWRVRGRTPGLGAVPEIRVRYRVYCNSIAERTRHVDDTHAFISPSAVLMYHEPMRAEALRVRLIGPDRWRVACGLEREGGRGGDERVLVAPNYDILVDSPIEWGVHERLEFDVEGVPHEIVIWEGATRVAKFDAEKLKADFAKIVAAQRDVFGDLPYGRYVFLIHCYSIGSGGTEHWNSTIMGCRPGAFDTPETYRRFLGLVSHEMFHTWNVKRLRPAGLVPYEYQRENYTNLLWVAEGTTSYYDDLTLARTGLMKVSDYLDGIGGMLENQRLRPGDSVQSAEASSFDAWIKYNKETPDSANSTISFYDKGALISLMLDCDVRARTNGEASLDTVMRRLYERHPLSAGGFDTEDVIGALAEVAGVEGAVYLDFYQRHIAGVEPMAYERLLEPFGLELVDPAVEAARKRAEKKDESKANEEEKPEEPKAWLGFTLTASASGGGVSVGTVSLSGPAYAAGLLPGDTLVAMNGQRVSGADLSPLLKRVKVGERARLSVFRYDVLREIEVEVREEPVKRKLKRVKSPSDEQKRLYEGWIGQTWE